MTLEISRGKLTEMWKNDEIYGWTTYEKKVIFRIYVSLVQGTLF